jgi:hypothetical protein
MNTLPEWFTVDPGRRYAVRRVRNGTPGPERTFSGKELHQGLAVEARAGDEVRLLVGPEG